MAEKEYPLKLVSEYYVVTANDLIKGRQKMTLRESQMLSIAIAQVVKEDTDFKTYTTTVPELAAFMMIDESSLYRDLEGICTSLLQRVVKIQIGGENARGRKKWKAFHWVSSAEYDNGKLTLRLSDDIKPFLLELESYYSQTMLGTLMTFRSYHTTRLYQYIKAESGAKWGNVSEWVFSCEQLRDLFQVAEKDKDGNYKKYKLNRNLINKTIKPALAELGASDFAYVYDYEEDTAHVPGKRGKPSLAGVRFKVIFFDTDEHRTAREKKDFFLAKSKAFIEKYNGSTMTEFSADKETSAAPIAANVPQEQDGDPYEQIAFAGCENMPEPPLCDDSKPSKAKKGQ